MNLSPSEIDDLVDATTADFARLLSLPAAESRAEVLTGLCRWAMSQRKHGGYTQEEADQMIRDGVADWDRVLLWNGIT